jgi:glucose-6-phosphate 1-epimerase
MASVHELTAAFSIEDVLSFDEPHPGFIRAHITSAACEAEVYLYGAHVTGWKPAGAAEDALFLSPRSKFEVGKAIRGGIPVIFPWFGARTVEITGHRTVGSQHGFARTSEWTLAFAAQVGDDVRLVLTLEPSEVSRAEGFDAFRCALEITFGRELIMRMIVGNEGDAPLVFEQALHTYYRVGDAEQVRVLGLRGAEFLDKTDNFARKAQHEDVLRFQSEGDRAYLNTPATVTIEDPVLARQIPVVKSGSLTTVTWNPWKTLSESMADLGADVWREFVCVETANAGENRVTLAPREASAMEMRVSVEPLA